MMSCVGIGQNEDMSKKVMSGAPSDLQVGKDLRESQRKL